MEKERFNFLVSNYNSLSQQETAELRLEQDHFGYCQVLHQLIARGDQDNQTEMKEHSLHVAAVHSTDRSVLRQIMTEPRSERNKVLPTASLVTPQPQVEQTSEPTPEAKVNDEGVKTTGRNATNQKGDLIVPKPDPDFDPEEVLSKFIADLKPMHEKRLQFEKAVEEFENKMNSSPSEVPEVVKPKRRGRPRKKIDDSAEETVNTTETLLEEIKSTKKKVTPEGQKQKEQSEIIEQFIKTKPSISKPTAGQAELDLTESIEFYNENVVSETLALILIKQGKKEKAIEVLRKLIWKFPQKKAYFAAQIEDLTK